MPAISRRPSQTSTRLPEPSYRSASSAGTPWRGRSTTERITPDTFTRCRSGVCETGTQPLARTASSRSSEASISSCEATARRRPSRSDSGDMSADLRDLRPALQRVERGCGRGGGLGGDAVGLVRQRQREQVARGAGLGAADDDRPAEQVLEGAGGLLVDRGAAGDDAAQEPAGAVDADEPRGAVAGAALGGARGEAGEQLAAERPGHVVDGAPLLAHGLADLLADLVPDAVGPRRGERLHLQGRAVDRHAD